MLSPEQLRVVGCLIEKAFTTPGQYPLSTNALTTACNQKSSRDPVVDYEERTVDAVMLSLREEKLARTVTSGRTNKHKHVLDEAWGLDDAQLSVLAVLFLRGPQTAGDLRTRTERYPVEADAIDSILQRLADRAEPLVRHLERQPGQRDRRWVHLAGEEAATSVAPSSAGPTPVTPVTPTPATPAPAPVVPRPDVEERVAALEAQVAHLYRLLGEDQPE